MDASHVHRVFLFCINYSHIRLERAEIFRFLASKNSRGQYKTVFIYDQPYLAKNIVIANLTDRKQNW